MRGRRFIRSRAKNGKNNRVRSLGRLRIHIGVNFYGAGNIGDDLMMAGFLRSLGQRAERVHLTCCTPHDIESQRARFPSIDWRPDAMSDRVQAISEADIWVALGDTPFQTASGSWMRDHLSQQMDLVADRSLPMFYLGVGVENDSALEDPIYRELAGAADQIWSRDTMSARALGVWTAAPVMAGGDLSHIYLSSPSAKLEPVANSQQAELGLLFAFEDPAQWNDLHLVLPKIAKDGATWLFQDVRTFAGSESDIFNGLPSGQRQRLPQAIPNYQASSVEELLASWPSCKLVASSRYHGLCIMAWRGARLVAIERSGKIAAAAADLDIPLFDCRAADEGLAAARIVQRGRLIDRAAAASAMVDDFCRVVGIAGLGRQHSKLGTDKQSPELASIERIAVVKCDSIGDFVLLSPFMRELRRIWPRASVTLYVRAPVAGLARLCPYADQVVIVWTEPDDVATIPAVADLAVPAEGFDLVFVPRAATDFYHGLQIAALIGGRERWGFTLAGDDNPGGLLTHAIPLPSPQSHARINLALLWEFTNAPVDDRLEVWPDGACIEEWRQRLGDGLAKPLCLLGIGAQHQFKIWNSRNFAALIPKIIDTFGMLPVLVGSADESDSALEILSLFPAGSILNLTGFSLEDVCALARWARLYVGNDTGPKHVAAAAGVPVVEINPFPPDYLESPDNSPLYFHPHGVPYELLHPPVGTAAEDVFTGAAINSIAPHDVIMAIGRLLQRLEAAQHGGRQTSDQNTAVEPEDDRRRLNKRVVELMTDRETQRRRIAKLQTTITEINQDREARLKLINEQQKQLIELQAQIMELHNHLGAANEERQARLTVINEQQVQIEGLRSHIREVEDQLIARALHLQQALAGLSAFGMSRWVKLGAALHLTKLRSSTKRD